MINTAVEKTFSLNKAARRCSSSRGEQSLCPSTLHRWRFPGLGGIRLECIKVGGVWHTSEEALQRFFEKLTAAQAARPEAGSHGLTRPAKRDRVTARDGHHARVEEELSAALGGPPRAGGKRAREGDPQPPSTGGTGHA